MKIAVTSAVFAAALRRGELTHLEWLEACASRLELDGVVLARDDVPRTDREYAAQVKKVATALGLVPVALDVPGLLDPDRRPDERRRTFRRRRSPGPSPPRRASPRLPRRPISH